MADSAQDKQIAALAAVASTPDQRRVVEKLTAAAWREAKPGETPGSVEPDDAPAVEPDADLAAQARAQAAAQAGPEAQTAPPARRTAAARQTATAPSTQD